MISPAKFYQELAAAGISFYAGVPDSLLRDFIAYVHDRTPPHLHVQAANEGTAVAAAAGHYLATGRAGLVYMQNSGLGNAVNPLVSLADPAVYAVPVLLLIGWRGEPGASDEPQHLKQGAVTLPLLRELAIPFQILDAASDARHAIAAAARMLRGAAGPAALVVRAGTFAAHAGLQQDVSRQLSRERAVEVIVSSLSPADAVVATTGKTSRELFEIRVRNKQSHAQDFLTVGSMGHASQVALGIALSQPQRLAWCLDGDGAVLMHMGGLAAIGQMQPANFRHIVLNNGVHDSVGGQPTAGTAVDFLQVARACRYQAAMHVETESELRAQLPTFRRLAGPSLLEIRVRPGARRNLGRPATSSQQNKEEFMRFLSG